MKITPKDFRVPPGKKVNLSQWPTTVKPYYESKEEYQEILEKHKGQLSKLQRLHYARNRYALLLIFQGMDSAGKDGAFATSCPASIRRAARLLSFKQPSQKS